MKFVEWCTLFETGHSEIDKQHQELFNIANQFHNEFIEHINAMYQGGLKKTENLFMNTLNRLTNYAQTHFTYEEKLLADLNCPKDYINKHKAIHEKLIEDIFELSSKFTKNAVTGIREIEAFVTKWLILHILVEDKKHSEYFYTQSSGSQKK